VQVFDMIQIAVDAMGGDTAPASVIEGAVAAADRYHIGVVLVGQQQAIKPYLQQYGTVIKKYIKVVDAPEVVGMYEAPSIALKQKKNSSINICMQLVKKQQADAVISAGNTGAVMASALFTLGRLQGISRPAIAATVPTRKEPCIVLDVGANVDCRPKHLVHFAVMGKIFVEKVYQREQPKVGLLSIGEEKSKGNELTFKTYALLEKSGLNFIGNVEGRDIATGNVDVVVCDGFIGNIIIKFAEGFGEMIMDAVKQEMRPFLSDKASHPQLQEAFRVFRKKIDYEEYGGAPLLGLNGTCIISHGGSSPKAIMNAIRLSADFAKDKVNQQIIQEIQTISLDMASKFK
jgi:glycerol-3-phosphate acyltransferase PlsX